MARPPAARPSCVLFWDRPSAAAAGRVLIKAYRYSLSGLVGFHCRHLPTCSHYAEEAMERFGLWAGGWMTLARLPAVSRGDVGARPGPGGAAAGSRWYLPWRYGRWRH